MRILKYCFLVALAGQLLTIDATAQHRDSTAARLSNPPRLSTIHISQPAHLLQQTDSVRKTDRGTYIVIGAVLGSAIGLALDSAGYLGTYEATVMNMMIFGALGGLVGALFYSRTR
jgi:hypothetical protein